MKRSLSLIVFLLSSSMLFLQAQVITWSVKPGTYSKIEPCWGDMYFAYSGNNIGIINGSGNIIVALDASRITGFYEGLALVLTSDGGHERILGILSKNGTYSKIDGTYYTIPYQDFFSEGLLTVTNSSGQSFYMNDKGVIVKSFDVSFVSPFSEGYAVVGEKQDYTLVDKRFNAQVIQLGTVSQVCGGSNVYHGTAVLWDDNGKFYSFDVKKGICNRISEPKSLDYDYLYCFSSITSRPENVPFEEITRSSEALSATKQGNLFGYSSIGKVILPCQFEQAESFHGNYAIVKFEGREGILSLHNTNETFSAKATSDIIYRQSANKNLPHRFGVTLPKQWGEDVVKVKVRDKDGNSINVNVKNGIYEFKANGSKGTMTYDVEIDAEGLKLWSGEIAYNYKVEAEPKPDDISHDTRPIGNLKPFIVSLKATNTQADKNNRCYIKTTVSNPNFESISATITIKGSNLLEAISKRITVPAKGSIDISTYFTVKKAVSSQTVTVTTSAGGSATLNGLQLIPF